MRKKKQGKGRYLVIGLAVSFAAGIFINSYSKKTLKYNKEPESVFRQSGSSGVANYDSLYDWNARIEGNKIILSPYIGDEQREIVYKSSPVEDSLLSVAQQEEFSAGDKKLLLIWLEGRPAGCTIESDKACVAFLGEILREFKEYGGLWVVDIDNNTLRYLGKPVVMGQENFVHHETPRFEINEERNEVAVSVTYFLSQTNDESPQENKGEYVVNLGSGAWTGVD